MKKTISAVLIFCLILSVTVFVPVSALTDDGNFETSAIAEQEMNLANNTAKEQEAANQLYADLSADSEISETGSKNDLAPTGSFDYGPYTCMTNSDNTIEIYKYNDVVRYDTLNIPSTIKGYTVVSIGNNAFKDSLRFTNVVIPDTVTNIGERAFGNCRNMKSITFGNSTQIILNYAFYGCTSLESVTIPDSVIILGKRVFNGCTGLKSAKIGNKVRNINEFAFAGCSALESVSIGNSVSSIEKQAFYLCSNLKSVSIPSSVKSIGEFAFGGSGLTTITIPNSVISVGNGAFMRCSSVRSARVGNQVERINEFAFADCTLLESVAIGGSVSSIEKQAFDSCSNLKRISLPTSVKSIGESAFCKSGLISIVIPDSVNTIGQLTFFQCRGLQSARIGNSVTSIPNGMFLSCTSLSSVSLPPTLVSIDEYAFSTCDSLQSIYIPKTVTYIGYHAFGTTPDPATGYDTYVPGFTIYAAPNTAAERYAKSYGFKFVVSLDTPYVTTLRNTVNGVSVSWGKVTGAAKYRVFRRTAKTSFAKVGDTAGTSFIDKTAVSGTTYCYTVRCLSADGKTFTSFVDSTGKNITYVAAPKIIRFDNLQNGTKITWQKAAGAAKYRISVKNGSTWQRLADITANTYTHRSLKSGVKYCYSITALNANGTALSGFNTTGYANTFIATPAPPTLKNTKNGVQVSWKRVAGAANYRIFRKTGSGKWTALAFPNKAFVDKTAKNGVTYSYTIRCVSADKKSYTSAYNTQGATIRCKR